MVKRFLVFILAFAIIISVFASCSSEGKQGIQGEKGEQGIQGEKGEKGEQGLQGFPGANGDKGADGRGIVKTEIKDGCLWITYSDDPENPVNAGNIIPEDDNPYDLDFYMLPDGTYGVMAGKSLYMDKIVIPEVYNGKTVTAILPSAFSGACNLTEISLPNTIAYIANSAFFNCSSLKEISIPSGVTVVSKQAFAYCTSLKKVTFSKNLTTISEQAFRDCTSLNNIVIGENVTSIGKNAFFNCVILDSVEFENVDSWKAESTLISSADISNTKTAATYLTKTYCSFTWTRG